MKLIWPIDEMGLPVRKGYLTPMLHAFLNQAEDQVHNEIHDGLNKTMASLLFVEWTVKDAMARRTP
jgi:hypothetical protein